MPRAALWPESAAGALYKFLIVNSLEVESRSAPCCTLISENNCMHKWLHHESSSMRVVPVQVNPMFHILLVGGQDAKSVTTTSASLGKFEALLWHMVYQEEIGTVRGHFGPLNRLAWRSLSRRTSSSRRFLA